MTFKELASKIADLEGKHSQASIGDIREILKLLFDLIASDNEILEFIETEAAKRKKK